MKGKRGGAQPGAGRPKGSKDPSTLERERVLAEIRTRITKVSQKILDAQLSIALGQQFLYMIHSDKKGHKEKPKLITDELTISAYLNGDLDNEPNNYYFITTKEPNNFAIDSMFDRTFGKAPQSIDLTSDGEALAQPLLYVLRNNNGHRKDNSINEKD